MNESSQSLKPVGLLGGTGEEGRGIVLRLAKAGVPVMIGSRSKDRAESLAQELNEDLKSTLIGGATNEELFNSCEILFLTVPFAFAADLLETSRSLFQSEHVLIDVTVPIYFDKGPRLQDLSEGSGSEYLRQFLPEEVPMVGTFKTLPAHLLSDLSSPLDCDEFVVADSPQARERVTEVLAQVDGVRWLNAGPLRYARCLEAMTLLAVSMNRRYKTKEGRYHFLGVDLGSEEH